MHLWGRSRKLVHRAGADGGASSDGGAGGHGLGGTMARLQHRGEDGSSASSSRLRKDDESMYSPRSPPRPQQNRTILLSLTNCIAAATAALVLLSVHVLYSVWLVTSDRGSHHRLETQTLRFEVCCGMSNQRLSLLYGIIMAGELNRVPVLPNFLKGTEQVPMETFYNVPYFIQRLAEVGIDVLQPREVLLPEAYHHVDLSEEKDPMKKLRSMASGYPRLSITCPLYHLPRPFFEGANSRIMMATLNGLIPNRVLARSVSTITDSLRSHSPEGRFNVLHARLESDWFEHCKEWEKISDGHVRNNCNNNTEILDQVLKSLNVRPGDPLYIATSWEDILPRRRHLTTLRLGQAGYKVFTSKDFNMDVSKEINALINYEVSLEAYKLIGNSVSTFTALNLFQRRPFGRWSSYYNGGNIPLSEYLPMATLPWVFTYSSHNAHWDYMIKAAVMSARIQHTIKPFCIYSGDANAPIAYWMAEHGVTLIFHQPTWSDDLWQKALPYKNTHLQLDYMYNSSEALQNAFVRMDLPLLPELEQYIYILYTEPDVFFNRKLSVSTFQPALPEIFGMATDPGSPDGVDGGVMLVNLPAARKTYQPFKVFILSHPNGPHFPKGPGVVGAYLEFYEATVKANRIPESFAAKPFREHDSDAHIVHFQGPKPHEYYEFTQTTKCPRGDTRCEPAFSYGLCQYVKKWRAFLNESEHEEGLALWYTCTAKYAPYLKDVCVAQQNSLVHAQR